MRVSPLALLAASGIVASAAHAQTVINVSGATLLENFLKAPASTNDYLDVDNDGLARINGTNDQLAPFTHPNFGAPVSGADQRWWAVQYRAVGSVNGFQELVDFGTTFVSGGANGQLTAISASKAFHNRTQYITNGVSSNAIFNSENPGGAPVRSDPVTLFATYAAPGNPSTGGVRIDAAPVDVPSVWAVQNTAGAGAYNRNPGQPGYGTNARRSTNAAGTLANANLSNLLANLGPRNLFDPNNPSAANSDTIFDTSIAFAPIAAITNLGTGLQQIKQSELRFGFATGRMPTGENLVFSTRDSGSGTRNGFKNSIGLDPSWGVGDNVGGEDGVGGSVLADEHKLGPDFVPANKLGSGDIESTVTNHRLAIGYTGAERGANSAWLTGGRMEVLGVLADLSGGTQYARPTIDNILDNNPATNPSLYVIGGPAIFATIGDPRNQNEIGGDPGNTNPRMPNPQAAAYLNNMTRSVSAFLGAPGTNPTLFTPGELLATQTLLTAATDSIQDKANPTQMISNAELNQSLQDFTRLNHVLGTPAYAAFGTVTLNGKVPNRKTGITYSDGVAGGANYVDQAGNIVSYGANLTSRNRISGDFNGDGQRNLADASEMLKAYRQRQGGPTWMPPAGSIAGAVASDAVIEILGDFNGDGSFDAKDIRYWADGLAIDPSTGMLDRKKGFEAIDNEWQSLTGSNNFFNTTIAGGGAYVAGYSAADIAGAPGNARGWAPVGANGIVDGDDLSYIQAQFIGNPLITDGQANWSNLNEAVGFDLSGDVTGDLIVDNADVALVQTILGTVPCYANCDGSTTAPVLNVADFSCFLTKFAAAETYANCDASTTEPVLNVADFSCFLTKFAAGCR